jgi:hypothetical protein
MDQPIVSLFIFVVIVFLYIHITAQWKKSEDLEIYETDYTTNTHLQEVCAVRQPVLFVFQQPTPIYESIQLSKMDKYSTYTVSVKDIHDYWKPADTTDGQREPTISVDSVELPFHSARRLFETDVSPRYISENNQTFLEETGLERTLSSMDIYLKPTLGVLYSRYDLLFAAKQSVTPMRYHTNTGYFLAPTAGKITVKMTPWKSRAYLYPVKDYEYYEFWSRVNVWNPLACHSTEMDKLRFLEFDVLPGYILSIPPYWWYSVRFSNDPDTCVCAFTYDTILNAAAHSYDWGLYYLQQNNITTRVSTSSGRPEIPNVVLPIEISNRNSTSSSSLPAEKADNQPELLPSNEQPMVAPKPPEKKEIITNMGTYHT